MFRVLQGFYECSIGVLEASYRVLEGFYKGAMRIDIVDSDNSDQVMEELAKKCQRGMSR